MAHFGKYGIIEGDTLNFSEEPELWWKILPVTAGMELGLTRFIQEGNKIILNGEEHVVPHNNIEIACREVALTFGGTNIPESAGSDKPALKVGASLEEIEKFLATMPQGMFLEIWTQVGELYPFWGPAKKVKKEPETAIVD